MSKKIIVEDINAELENFIDKHKKEEYLFSKEKDAGIILGLQHAIFLVNKAV